ncbi:hypothetical protein [Eisenibacter elegans]|nr:hypothetical protein [Eisenibacter elegans]
MSVTVITVLIFLYFAADTFVSLLIQSSAMPRTMSVTVITISKKQ